MAYLVMARKWRPRNFEEMVGQDHIARTLRNAIEGKRIAHAYLFTGTRGVGKTTSARILAKALNCEKGPTPTPCEICDSCRAVAAGTSMDVLEIDGASNRGVGEIRELREQVKYAPMQGTYKVYIIDEVHMLTKEAFNALLKTLEEPPPHVVFLFATTEANKVPHTILSRVQRFDFKRISEAQIRGRLEFICGKEDITFETEALEAIARKADGSMRDALSLFDQVIAFSGSSLSLDDARRILGLPPDTLFTDLLDALVAHDGAACYRLLERVVGEGIELGEFLLGFGSHLRDVLFARQEGIGATSLGFSENRFRDLRATHVDLRDGDLIRYGKIVSDLLAGLRTAAHPRLHVEMGLLRMAALDRIATLSQLMQSGAGAAIVETGGAHALATPDAGPGVAASLSKKPSNPTATEPAKFPTTPIAVAEYAPAKTASPYSDSASNLTAAFEPVTDDFSLAGAAKKNDPGPSPLVATEDGPDYDLDGPEPYFDGDEEMPIRPKPAPEAPPVLVFEGLDDLAEKWSLLLEAFSQETTLVSIHLGNSRAQVDRENQRLKIEVAHPIALDFFQGNGDGRRKLQAMLKERMRQALEIPLHVTLQEAGTALTPTKTVASGQKKRLIDEPIVQTLMQIFEGRILSGG